jgi:hypothetical protein
MAKHGTSTQQDLFEEPPLSTRLEATERAKALEQLQALLMEAVAISGGQPEAGDDQDHA